MSVDVVVCTYNSASTLKPCLESIKQNVPVNNLWVIDNYSTDKTAEIAQNYGAKIFYTNHSLASARKLSFQLVQTPLFVNVDSDIVLSKDWYKENMKYWREDAGCVWGVTVDQNRLSKAYCESMWKLRRAESYNISHLPDMIARKDVLEDIQYPHGILGGSIANEDIAVKNWIEHKGFRCITTPIRVNHYCVYKKHKALWYGASARLSHLASFRSILIRVALALPQAIYAGLASHNAQVIPYWTRYRLQILYGYLHSAKYCNLKRVVRRC